MKNTDVMAHKPAEIPTAAKSHPHLFGRTARGMQWVFAMRITAQVLSLARLIVLSWFLSPSDFGLMGIALVTLAFIETFTETGFVSALVQKPHPDDLDLDSAWSVAFIRGIAVFLVIYLAAPLAVRFFGDSPAATFDIGLAVWV
ncbi:MAG TPA: oligosaccharide flippase family protein, partial [Sedimentisphaerales bacterium]|nr:oligosaccharide flippase family protein [Sedimentisphaerales bacterium]